MAIQSQEKSFHVSGETVKLRIERRLRVIGQAETDRGLRLYAPNCETL